MSQNYELHCANVDRLKTNYRVDKHINTVFDFQNIDEETVRKTIQNIPQKIVVD